MTQHSPVFRSRDVLRGVVVLFMALAAGYFGYLVATYFSSKAPPVPAAAARPSPATTVTRTNVMSPGQQPVVQTPTNDNVAPHTAATSQAPGQTDAPETTSAAAVPQAAPPSSPAPKRGAVPGGSYYLSQRVTVTTDSGVMGISAGTQIVLLEQLENGNFVATNGPEDFEIAPEQITNDPAAAGLSPQRNGGAQQVLAARKQRQLHPPPRTTPPAATPIPRLNPNAPPVVPTGPTAPTAPFQRPYVAPPATDLPGMP